MSRPCPCILASLAAAALLSVAWLASGGPVLAQERSTTENGTQEDRQDADGGDRGDRRDRSDRAERRDDDRADDQRGQPEQPTTASRESRSAIPAPSRNTRGAGGTPPRPEDFAERFAVVYEKNIFLRDRPTYSPSGRAATPTTGPSTFAPKRPEESFVLTGIAIQEGRHVAVIEDTETGETKRVLSGEGIAEGKVTVLDLDALEFDLKGKRTRIAIGRNLAGAVVFTPPPAAPVAAAAPARPPGGAPPGAPGGMPGAPGGPAIPGAPSAPGAPAAGASGATDPNNPSLSIEERMKLRRAQQLGSK